MYAVSIKLTRKKHQNFEIKEALKLLRVVNSDFEVIVAKATEFIYICHEMTAATIMLNKMSLILL